MECYVKNKLKEKPCEQYLGGKKKSIQIAAGSHLYLPVKNRQFSFQRRATKDTDDGGIETAQG